MPRTPRDFNPHWRLAPSPAQRLGPSPTRNASLRLGLLAVDQVVDIAGNTRRLVAVLTGGLRDREHLLGEADERHRDLHLARHIEPEVHVLWHPRLARLVIAAHHDLHDAPGCHRIL